jgi:hypothetical protein
MALLRKILLFRRILLKRLPTKQFAVEIILFIWMLELRLKDALLPKLAT